MCASECTACPGCVPLFACILSVTAGDKNKKPEEPKAAGPTGGVQPGLPQDAGRGIEGPEPLMGVKRLDKVEEGDLVSGNSAVSALVSFQRSHMSMLKLHPCMSNIHASVSWSCRCVSSLYVSGIQTNSTVHATQCTHYSPQQSLGSCRCSLQVGLGNNSYFDLLLAIVTAKSVLRL